MNPTHKTMAPQSPSQSLRRQLPQPVETTTKVRRRFAPEPLETTSRSNGTSLSKDRHDDIGNSNLRRLAPQSNEFSASAARLAQEHQSQEQRSDDAGLKASIRTLPQSFDTSAAKTKPRKFSPQLVESTKRSRKSGDSGPTVLPHDKTDYSPGEPEHSHRPWRLGRPLAVPSPPANSPAISTDEVPRALESRFSSSALRKKEPRRHSFRIPDLAPIQSTGDSEGSNESACPSLSTSPSAGSDETELEKHRNRPQKSGDAESSGYLLLVAAQSAEKQLRAQVMAAYPNEHQHEPVEHFAGDRDDYDPEDDRGLRGRSDDTPKASHRDRRDSEAGWDSSKTLRHQETLKTQKNGVHVTVEPEVNAPRVGKTQVQGQAPFTKGFDKFHGQFLPEQGKLQKDAEMEKMRSAASPPMAGQSLIFPMCVSPRQTRLDVTQYPSEKKPHGAATSQKLSGLWTPKGIVSKHESLHGLWMGTSAKPIEATLEPSPIVQTGLLTPKSEREDPFTSAYNESKLPPSPPLSQGESKVCCLDAILSQEQRIDLEFHDAFVTQVYNYLSLGYPSLARKFDFELSKISKVPIEELRQDDNQTNAKGYVGAPEGYGSRDVNGKDGITCARWGALRKYVREWARQQSHLLSAEKMGGEWGQRARRGSWAI